MLKKQSKQLTNREEEKKEIYLTEGYVHELEGELVIQIERETGAYYYLYEIKRKIICGRVMTLAVDIYENVFIGNFIYILGVQIGMALRDQKKEVPTCINLLQQTPADKLLGDMLADFPGCSFLIEFKRERNKDKKEKGKIDILRKALNNDSEMTIISRSAHWFIQIKDSIKGEPKTSVVPYLEMGQINTLTEDENKSFEFFIKEIVIEALDLPEKEEVKAVGASAKEMSLYLKLLKKVYGSNSELKLGGIIINVSKDGMLSYVVTNDITKTHKKVIEEYQQVMEKTLQRGIGGR